MAEMGTCFRSSTSPVRLFHRAHALPQKFLAEEQGPVFNDDLFWVQTLCNQGQLEMAVNKLCAMETPPSSRTYLSLLKACNNRKALSQAQQVHAHLARHQISLSGFLGDYLVMTLARCGAVDDALELFPGLSCRTVYSWTAMMSAYTERGCGEEALRLYDQMLDDGVEPDSYTFVCLFKACGSTLDLVCGKQLHSDARMKGLAADIFVGNTLMSMYGKCGSLEEAEDVFRELSSHNIVSWCVLLSVYVDQGQGGQALLLYRQMLEEGVNPGRLGSMVALQACGLLVEVEECLGTEGDYTVVLLQIGQAIQVDARRKGFLSDAYFNSALVSMYGKAASIVEAENAFHSLTQGNSVSWNALLSAFVGQGRGERVLWLYKQMQQEGVCPDQLSLVFALQACSILTAKEELLDRRLSKMMCLEVGQALHSDACKRGVAFDAVLSSALMNMYGKCEALLAVEFVFVSSSEHNIVSWNAMLTAYIEQGQSVKALTLYRQLQEERLSPDELSVTIALQACMGFLETEAASNFDSLSNEAMVLELGRSLHADARSRGWASELFVGNALLKMYAKCGFVVEVEHVFNNLSQPDLASWNVILRAYAEQGQEEKALALFGQMLKLGVAYDDITAISIFQACSATGSLELSSHLHFHMAFLGYAEAPTAVAAAIHAYGCCASMADAEAVLDTVWDPPVSSWNSCISGYAGEANYRASSHLFEMLRLSGLMPNEATFTSLLSACSHTGAVIEALEFFESICIDYGLTTDAQHISIVLDLLGRVGDFRRIEDMFVRMETQADLSSLLGLMGACRVHGNLSLAKHVFEYAVKFHSKEAPVYILMSNIYADCGMECAVEG